MNNYLNFIAGQWQAGASPEDNINPSDLSDVIGHRFDASVDDVTAAIGSATQAQPEWASSTPQQRSDVLDRVGSELLARRQELGELLSREEGKTMAEGIGEVTRAGQIFKFFAGESLRPEGLCLPSVRPGVRVDVTRHPVGVVGIITPWNFPMAIPAWKIAPALCFGNAVVFKPSEEVPACAHALAEILSRSGLPEGVFNLVNGNGADVGQVIIDSPAVAAVSFTGSVDTGARVLAATQARQARVQLEMGGKNPLIVLDDARLDVAIECAVQGAYFSTGQRCTASSRLIVTKQVADDFVAGLLHRLDGLTTGHALDEGTDIGPMVNQAQLDKSLAYLDIGRSEGASLLAGGEPVQCRTEGYYLSPALFDDTTADMRICREEIFGPVAAIQRVKDYDQALAVANDTEFGLSAGICTQSAVHAADFQANAQAGMTMVNLPTAGVDYHVPFGGCKSSSYGPREQGSHAREFYTTVRTGYSSF